MATRQKAVGRGLWAVGRRTSGRDQRSSALQTAIVPVSDFDVLPTAHGPRPTAARGGALLLALLLALLSFTVLALPARADALDDQVRAISKELRCPVCDGETVADSNATVSVQMRGVIRQKLEAGESREQIIQHFVDLYGISILAEPPARGFTLGVWVAPVVALLVGLVVVGIVLRGWYRGGEPARVPVATGAGPALATDDDERLERELARFRSGGAR